jgi:hypothetical protein
MDYKASEATFYKGGPKVFLKGEKVIAAIPFQTPGSPNDPVLAARIGDTEFETILDTGQYGNIFADAATFKDLTAQGAIRPVAGEDSPVNVAALRFSTGPAIALAKLATHPSEDAAPFSKSIGVKSSRIMSLGYALLKQYKTVWGYPHGMFYLLER